MSTPLISIWLAPEGIEPIISVINNPDRNEDYYTYSFGEGDKGEYAVYIYKTYPPDLYICTSLIVK